MSWGGGISGEIKKDLGMMESVVDDERKNLMVEFNHLVEEEQGGGNKYQCANCGKEFDKTSNPPVDGKYCSDKCKNEESHKYTCDKCNKEFTDNPTVKNGKNYCSNCKDKADDDDKKSFEEWQEELKELGNDMGQSFDENKVKQ